MKVAYILSYKYPDYIRTRVLTKMLRAMDDVTLYECINTRRGIVRYIDTSLQLVWTRLTRRPDMYILGFRGAESFWLFRLLTAGRPLIYDEFLNPYLWSVEEHSKVDSGSFLASLIKGYTSFTARASKRVLSDTNLHAHYSASLANTALDKFTTLYVGTDEDVFHPSISNDAGNGEFTVFFYGTFLPLHGLDVILAAAKSLEDLSDVHFVIIGGASRARDMEAFKQKLVAGNYKNITHKPWVAFEELPSYIDRAGLCLGGPFAGSPQAQVVITGKTYQFLAMSRPTVIGKIDESKEVGFRNKKNCLLINQNDSGALADVIRWSYEHQPELIKIGKAGRVLYEKKFSMQAQVDKFHKVLIAAMDK